MLLLAFAGLGASCSDDETNGGDTSGIAGRSELQTPPVTRRPTSKSRTPERDGKPLSIRTS